MDDEQRAEADEKWEGLAGYAAVERLSRQVEDALAQIQAPVVSLIAYSRRNRAVIWWLAVTTAIDVVASGVSIYAVIRATEATRQVATACDSRNAFKVLDLSRWQYILDQSRSAPPTGTPAQQAEQAKQVVKFRAFITRADAPEEC